MRDRNCTAPAFSPMFIRPSQSVITPVSGSAICITADSEAVNVLSIMALKTCVSPAKMAFRAAAAMATRKNPTQM